MRTITRFLVPALVIALLPCAAVAGEDPAEVRQAPDGKIHAGDEVFDSWGDYAASEFFVTYGKRCGKPARTEPLDKAARLGNAGDCTLGITVPANDYDPAVDRYRIEVVVHVIQDQNGQGFLSEAQVESQIDILNEDFLALLGTNGENGTNIEIEFVLADLDPDGAPTNGITYSTSSVWFNDGGAYWNTLNWDPTRYLNIYTNTASGNLGYVPALPNGGTIAGQPEDRVVVLWSSFGANGAIGPPYNQGRTTTHEVGHYLGLDHTFGNFTCGSATECYTTGDLVCDTEPQNNPTSGCFDRGTCGDPDPIENYMDYSDDLCMEEFTPEQARRMRCTLLNYRPGLLTVVPGNCGNGVIDLGEDCDDGNRIPGDGCDALCILEDNDCCDTGHGAGCSSGVIEECLCAADSYCCDTAWDDLCVVGVNQFGCGSCDIDGVPLEIGVGDVEPLRFTSQLILNWGLADRTGLVTYNLYRGSIDDIPSGDYGSCLYTGLSNNGAVDPATPPSGRGYSYLVTGTNGLGEGPLGYQSSGAERPNDSPCVSARRSP